MKFHTRLRHGKLRLVTRKPVYWCGYFVCINTKNWIKWVN